MSCAQCLTLANLITQAGLEMPTAEDMAEYILSTGDQQTVAQLIEAMVEGGEVSSKLQSLSKWQTPS